MYDSSNKKCNGVDLFSASGDQHGRLVSPQTSAASPGQDGHVRPTWFRTLPDRASQNVILALLGRLFGPVWGGVGCPAGACLSRTGTAKPEVSCHQRPSRWQKGTGLANLLPH